MTTQETVERKYVIFAREIAKIVATSKNKYTIDQVAEMIQDQFEAWATEQYVHLSA